MIRCALVCFALVVWAGSGAAQELTDAQIRSRLEEARQAIESRRYDRALESLRPILDEPELAPSMEIEALFLRAWASEARGKLAEADKDWERILRARPAFEPAPETVSEKARARFRSVRAAIVGHLRVVVDPPDAQVSVNGQSIPADLEAGLPLNAGAHVVSASRAGFDPQDQTVAVVAGQTAEVRLDLVPNAGALVIRTIPDGVTVRLDGQPVGVTSRPLGSDGDAGAVLLLEGLPLGEHRIELDKPCHRRTALTVTVDANLLDRSDRTIGPITLAPATATLKLEGGRADAVVFIDGERVGEVSSSPFSTCPGTRRIEVRVGARVLWGESAELATDAELTLAVRPRPSMLLYGAEAWPESIARMGSTFAWRAGGDLPAAPATMTAEDLAALGGANDADLVVALVSESKGAPRRWLVISPMLGTVAPLEARLSTERPRWLEGDLGIEVADSQIGGAALAVRVAPDGPGARAGLVVGDRILELAGRPIESARGFREAIDADPVRGPVALRFERRGGEARAVQLERRLRARSEDPADDARAAIAAAWARADAVALPADGAAAALANLATMLARAGRHRESAATWDAVLGLGSSAVCRGTAAYYRGVELEAAAHGATAESSEAFRMAAESACAAFGAPEALVAPAARARLARSLAPTVR